jgi:hypothetical protein
MSHREDGRMDAVGLSSESLRRGRRYVDGLVESSMPLHRRRKDRESAFGQVYAAKLLCLPPLNSTGGKYSRNKDC